MESADTRAAPEANQHVKQALEEDVAPDSWETADLEERLKKLKPPSSEATGDAGVEGSADEGTKSSSRQGSNEAGAFPDQPDSSDSTAVGSLDNVDTFLREALQNSRDRLTILRMDHEVEKFMRNSQLQQYEFAAMPSSYLRLAAHRVAQHYGLQTYAMLDQPNIIVARKNADCRFPSVKLCDIGPANASAGSGASLAVPPGVKVAIKQRPSNGGSGDGGSGGLKIGPQKSVEERKEDYNRARARIFSSGSPSGSSSNLEAQALEAAESVAKEKEVKEGVKSPPRDEDRGSMIDRGPSGELSSGDGAGRGRGGRGVAIFRDKEKERRDPDFDRSYDRYSSRFDPGFGMPQMAPYSVPGLYAPTVNYNSEFPSLANTTSRGGSPAPVPPPRMEAHPHMPGSWMTTPLGAMYHPGPEVMAHYGMAGAPPPQGGYANGGVYMQPHPYGQQPVQGGMYVQQDQYQVNSQQFDPRYTAPRRR